MQKTIRLNDKKIKVKSYKRSYCGNFAGWYIRINDKKYFTNILEKENAEKYCIEKYLKGDISHD